MTSSLPGPVSGSKPKGMLARLRGWIFILACAALVAGIGYKKPTHEWDMIAYVASALYDDGLRGEELRAETYAQVRADVNDKEYARLVGADPLSTGQHDADYRAGVARDPVALEQQLPFYRVKFVYMALVKGAHALGLPYVKATYAVSAAFAAAMVVVCGLLLMNLGLPLFLLPVGVTAANICALNNGVIGSLASQSTPDAFGGFCALLCLTLAARKDSFGLIAAALIPLARPDYIILSAAVVTAIVFMRRDEFLPDPSRLTAGARKMLAGAALSLACAGTIYLAQNRFLGAYSFATLFNFSFIGFSPYPKDMALTGHALDYLRAYVLGAKQTFESRHFIVLGLTVAALANPLARAWTRDRFTAFFAAAPLAYVTIHLAIFPEYFDRLFAFAALAMFVWLARFVVGFRDAVAGGGEARPRWAGAPVAAE